ncbi:PKD domain-containing protein [Nocardioides caldifontis]|uniref:PKD domain-containing protein n=1 Tax=Nocardioides caldifontis TaxID=2588938 RepID=UPI001396A19B|nr:PKD domain-containing protein [Nocardioides caldifontis]
MSRARRARSTTSVAAALSVLLSMLGAAALVAVTSTPASAVISGNVLSGTASRMWQTNSEVDALAVANGVIYAGGKFTQALPPAGTTGSAANRTGLAAFNASTGNLITTFNVNLRTSTGAAARVTALAVSPDGTRLYIGGNFTTVNGTTRNRLAAVNPTTGALVTAFNPNPSAAVHAIAPTNTTVYIGGDFTRVGGTAGAARTNLASVTAATGAVNAAFNPTLVAGPPTPDTTPSPRVNALALASDGSRVLAGGSFQTVNGVLTGGMVSLDPTDASLETWNANVLGQQPINTNCGGRTTDIVVSGTTAYVTAEGDPPGCYEGTYAANVSDGAMAWNASCLGASQGLAVAGGVLYKGSHQHDCAFMEGGAFGGYVGGVAREAFIHRYLVGQDVRDGSFVHWSPNTNATATGGTTSVGPQVMASDGRQVVVGGDFTRVNGATQAGLARFEPLGDTAAPEVVGRSFNGDPWPDVTPYTVMRMPVTVQPTAAGTLTVQWPATHDPDTGTLTYRLYRDGSNTPIAAATQTVESWHWTRPVLRFDDTGLAPGSTHSYRVDATDGAGHTSTRSTAVSGTVRTSAPPPFASAYSATNPAVWWRLGESGTSVADSSTTAGTPGQLQGGVTTGVPGVASDNTAITLNGSSGYVTSNTTITPSTAFTQAVWFRTTTRRGGVLLALSSNQTGAGGTTDRSIVMDNNGALVLGLGRTGVRNQGPVWNDGRWHQAVATYDGNGNSTLYVDGWRQVCTTNVVSSPDCATMTRLPATPGPSYLRVGYADTTSTQLVFGRNFYARKWPLSDYFSGSVDEPMVIPRALTAAEVADLFAAGVAGLGGSGPQPTPPTAGFTSQATGLSATFTSTSTDDEPLPAAAYSWDFGDSTPAGTGATTSHTYAAAGTYTVTLTVTDADGLVDTETRTVVVSEPTGTPTDSTVVAGGSAWSWRYATGAPPTGWNTLAAFPSAWAVGNGVFGFGNTGAANPVTTNIDCAGCSTNTANRPLAAYFTKRFTVADASQALNLRLTTRADDGIVVYVNGVEVGRSNMPAGTVTVGTFAGPARSTATAVANPVVIDVPPSLLVTGQNVVSVETHLNYRNTPNVSFDLEAVLTSQ